MNYLNKAKSRYVRRLKDNFTKGMTKGIMDWSDLMAKQEERKQVEIDISGSWLRSWNDSGYETKKEVYRKAKKKPSNSLYELADDEVARLAIEALADEVTRTTATAIKVIVDRGVIEDWSLKDIIESIEQATAFDSARATLWGRTEATRATNKASLQAYREAQQDGIKVLKKWLNAPYGDYREAHNELAKMKPIGVNELFWIGNLSAECPATFGEASQDCNCRCVLQPIVID